MLILYPAVDAAPQVFKIKGATLTSRAHIHIKNLPLTNLNLGNIILKDTSYLYTNSLLTNTSGRIKLTGKAAAVLDAGLINSDSLLLFDSTRIVLGGDLVNHFYIFNSHLIELGKTP